MAHGNFSDLVFLALLGIVVQWLAFPTTLYQDLGPLKAQFKFSSQSSADMDAIVKFGAVLLLMIGLTFSGVKWNPINGKMAGFFGLVTMGHFAFTTFKADSDVFVPRLFYGYAAILFLGSLHIFIFPSNALPEKTPETKNNHGNSSDLVALGLVAASLLGLFYPDHLFQDFGPIKAQFSDTKNTDLSVMIQFVSSLMLIIALMLSGVKWNPINGKMAGFGGFIAAGYTAYFTFQKDSQKLVPRIFYIYAFLLFLGAVHIFLFPSNPLLAKASEGKKNK